MRRHVESCVFPEEKSKVGTASLKKATFERFIRFEMQERMTANHRSSRQYGGASPHSFPVDGQTTPMSPGQTFEYTVPDIFGRHGRGSGSDITRRVWSGRIYLEGVE